MYNEDIENKEASIHQGIDSEAMETMLGQISNSTAIAVEIMEFIQEMNETERENYLKRSGFSLPEGSSGL